MSSSAGNPSALSVRLSSVTETRTPSVRQGVARGVTNDAALRKVEEHDALILDRNQPDVMHLRAARD